MHYIELCQGLETNTSSNNLQEKNERSRLFGYLYDFLRTFEAIAYDHAMLPSQFTREAGSVLSSVRSTASTILRRNILWCIIRNGQLGRSNQRVLRLQPYLRKKLEGPRE
eukprot:snap_masked-scaffold_10-processed-gene-6.31-mRNA-1 protein AED:1.00 eAED:1.00 QI:0/-1/0/0/-1/1/1/0/109